MSCLPRFGGFTHRTDHLDTRWLGRCSCTCQVRPVSRPALCSSRMDISPVTPPKKKKKKELLQFPQPAHDSAESKPQMLAKPTWPTLPIQMLLMHCARQQHSFSSTVSNKLPELLSEQACCCMSMVTSPHDAQRVSEGAPEVFTLDELRQALKQSARDKKPGSDGLPYELYCQFLFYSSGWES